MPTNDDLKKYADVAIHVGVGLGKGDRLIISSPIAAADFTRLLVEVAYTAGASNVDVIWADDEVTKARFSHGTKEASESISGFSHLLNASVDGGDAMLQIKADDPNLLGSQDPEKVAGFQRVNSESVKRFRESMASLAKNWSVAAVPTPVWAKAVFPDLAESEAVEALWEAVLRTCRIDQPDPVAGWREHLAHLAARSDYLNRKAYDALRYYGPGTDLTLGLPRGHVWVGGGGSNPSGSSFVPNLPTEEVFTAPHRLRGEGTVTATKPLSLFGSLVEDFSFEVAGGKVVMATAGTGQEILDKVLQADESAVRFGEAALVPQSSAVAKEGLVWRNMLFDENDACHIALGTAYSISIQDGPEMSPDERQERGLNESSIHVDFVIGSNQLDIYGVGVDGSEELVLAKGEWAFDV